MVRVSIELPACGCSVQNKVLKPLYLSDAYPLENTSNVPTAYISHEYPLAAVPATYDACLRGMHLLRNERNKEAIDRSIAYFEAAPLTPVGDDRTLHIR